MKSWVAISLAFLLGLSPLASGVPKQQSPANHKPKCNPTSEDPAKHKAPEPERKSKPKKKTLAKRPKPKVKKTAKRPATRPVVHHKQKPPHPPVPQPPTPPRTAHRVRPVPQVSGTSLLLAPGAADEAGLDGLAPP